jgi:hypothetical protein
MARFGEKLVSERGRITTTWEAFVSSLLGSAVDDLPKVRIRIRRVVTN